MRKLEQMVGNRQIAICNIGKFQEDFQYIFDDIKPVYYIDNHFLENEYHGCKVFKTQELTEDLLTSVLIIVCDLEAHLPKTVGREWQDLECRGLEMGTDFIFAEELFSMLDYDWRDSLNGRKIAFWGTGGISRRFYMESISEKWSEFQYC